ncbi:MAG: transposase [Desulfuromonadaceae bacterium]|nr:transposase [Desulfuromonadaceae bacterium]
MARKPRIHYPGAVYHVILRGNAGHPIFFDDRDRLRLYLFLQRAVEKFDCRIHAFCLMTNHIHLVIQIGAIPLSRIMQNISQRYTKWINYSQSRTGHVFQGRYKALLIDADSYLLELVRYIHLNPVRAGMTPLPGDYTWSSHRAYARRESIPWLATEWVLSFLESDAGRAVQQYEQFIADGMGEQRRNEFHSGTCEGRIVGDEAFADEVLALADEIHVRRYELTDVAGAVCRVYGISEEMLRAPGKVRHCSEARGVAALLVLESPTLSLTSLGEYLKRNIAPLGRSARRVAAMAPDDAGLYKKLSAVRDELARIAESQA